jgi:6-phosphogluconolactonase
MSDPLVFVGTYTRGASEGIYVCRMDPATGGLEQVATASGIANPSFRALHPHSPHLYAVHEGGEGSVSAFAMDAESGELTHLNQQPSGGAGPCHLTVDQTGRSVIVANYGSGSAAVLPIDDDGRLAPPSHVVQHEGSSVHPQRQEGPHAHSVTIDPSNRFVFVADLGVDKVMIYELDLDAGKLAPSEVSSVGVAPGAGPRHFDFHPSGRYAYLINELGNTIVAYQYDGASGALTEVQTVPTLPADFDGRSTCADIHVAPSGRFVYGSNRGHDSIVIYAIDGETGSLTYVGHEPTGGETPRNFGIDPTGTLLLAANQNSDTIVAFRVDEESGRLSPTGATAFVPAPVCVKFAVP